MTLSEGMKLGRGGSLRREPPCSSCYWAGFLDLATKTTIKATAAIPPPAKSIISNGRGSVGGGVVVSLVVDVVSVVVVVVVSVVVVVVVAAFTVIHTLSEAQLLLVSYTTQV
ncbi:hypothetical protein EU546_00940 [Candidatus Thorarchaeota archaeon]|nr:MAG: hypothetical protein EU546_00940 [Candidatus Thorarchaeota archaeon]